MCGSMVKSSLVLRLHGVRSFQTKCKQIPGISNHFTLEKMVFDGFPQDWPYPQLVLPIEEHRKNTLGHPAILDFSIKQVKSIRYAIVEPECCAALFCLPFEINGTTSPAPNEGMDWRNWVNEFRSNIVFFSAFVNPKP